jgi:hypothetical protein
MNTYMYGWAEAHEQDYEELMEALKAENQED